MDVQTPPRFSLGQTVATPGAMELLDRDGVSFITLLMRHARGDFGDLDDEDRQINEDAVREGFRVLSSYELESGKVWVITEYDRSATTILLPSEY